MKKKKITSEDRHWRWFWAISSIFICLLIVLIVNYINPLSKSKPLSSHIKPLSTPITPSQLIFQPKHYPPVLKSLIVHPNDAHNYFDFILDIGNEEIDLDEENLKPTAKQLIKYFFLGLTLPSEDFWVNLNPVQPDRITSSRLTATDIGKVLLEADLRLKKDTARLTDPRTPTGKQYWQILNQRLKEEGLSNYQVPGLNRVWIIPHKAVVEEDDDKNKASITSAKLKVCLESEYLQDYTSSLSPTEEKLLNLASEAMKEAVLPTLEYKVNYSKSYAPLRQVYYSLILAEYFKQRYWQTNSLYSRCVNQAYLDGLHSTVPWSKDKFFQAYLDSHQNGEYSFYQKEYSPLQLAMVERHYFSGGVSFDNLAQVGEVLKIKKAGSPVAVKEDGQEGVITIDFAGAFEKTQDALYAPADGLEIYVRAINSGKDPWDISVWIEEVSPEAAEVDIMLAKATVPQPKIEISASPITEVKGLSKKESGKKGGIDFTELGKTTSSAAGEAEKWEKELTPLLEKIKQMSDKLEEVAQKIRDLKDSNDIDEMLKGSLTLIAYLDVLPQRDEKSAGIQSKLDEMTRNINRVYKRLEEEKQREEIRKGKLWQRLFKKKTIEDRIKAIEGQIPRLKELAELSRAGEDKSWRLREEIQSSRLSILSFIKHDIGDKFGESYAYLLGSFPREIPLSDAVRKLRELDKKLKRYKDILNSASRKDIYYSRYKSPPEEENEAYIRNIIGRQRIPLINLIAKEMYRYPELKVAKEDIQYLEQVIIESLLSYVSHSDESVYSGYALLKFRSPEALLLNILNAFREPGHSGEHPFIYLAGRGSDTELYKLVTSLTEDEEGALKDLQVPKLEELIELIKNNPSDLVAIGPVNDQVRRYLFEIAFYFLRQGSQKMELFMLDLIGHLYLETWPSDEFRPLLISKLSKYSTKEGSSYSYLTLRLFRALLGTTSSEQEILNLALELLQNERLQKQKEDIIKELISNVVSDIKIQKKSLQGFLKLTDTKNTDQKQLVSKIIIRSLNAVGDISLTEEQFKTVLETNSFIPETEKGQFVVAIRNALNLNSSLLPIFMLQKDLFPNIAHPSVKTAVETKGLSEKVKKFLWNSVVFETNASKDKVLILDILMENSLSSLPEAIPFVIDKMKDETNLKQTAQALSYLVSQYSPQQWSNAELMSIKYNLSQKGGLKLNGISPKMERDTLTYALTTIDNLASIDISAIDVVNYLLKENDPFTLREFANMDTQQINAFGENLSKIIAILNKAKNIKLKISLIKEVLRTGRILSQIGSAFESVSDEEVQNLKTISYHQYIIQELDKQYKGVKDKIDKINLADKKEINQAIEVTFEDYHKLAQGLGTKEIEEIYKDWQAIQKKVKEITAIKQLRTLKNLLEFPLASSLRAQMSIKREQRSIEDLLMDLKGQAYDYRANVLKNYIVNIRQKFLKDIIEGEIAQGYEMPSDLDNVIIGYYSTQYQSQLKKDIADLLKVYIQEGKEAANLNRLREAEKTLRAWGYNIEPFLEGVEYAVESEAINIAEFQRQKEEKIKEHLEEVKQHFTEIDVEQTIIENLFERFSSQNFLKMQEEGTIAFLDKEAKENFSATALNKWNIYLAMDITGHLIEAQRIKTKELQPSKPKEWIFYLSTDPVEIMNMGVDMGGSCLSLLTGGNKHSALINAIDGFKAVVFVKDASTKQRIGRRLLVLTPEGFVVHREFNSNINNNLGQGWVGLFRKLSQKSGKDVRIPLNIATYDTNLSNALSNVPTVEKEEVITTTLGKHFDIWYDDLHLITKRYEREATIHIPKSKTIEFEFVSSPLEERETASSAVEGMNTGEFKKLINLALAGDEKSAQRLIEFLRSLWKFNKRDRANEQRFNDIVENRLTPQEREFIEGIEAIEYYIDEGNKWLQQADKERGLYPDTPTEAIESYGLAIKAFRKILYWVKNGSFAARFREQVARESITTARKEIEALNDPIKKFLPYPTEETPFPTPFGVYIPADSWDTSPVYGKYPPEGWKLYVSATPENAVEIYKIVIPILIKERIAHKARRSIKSIKDGRVIVIYPRSSEEGVRIARILYEALKDRRFSGPAPEGAGVIGDTKVIYYRYAEIGRGYFVTPDGKTIKDDKQFTIKPSWIEIDPFVEAGLAIASSPVSGIDFRDIDLKGEHGADSKRPKALERQGPASAPESVSSPFQDENVGGVDFGGIEIKVRGE